MNGRLLGGPGLLLLVACNAAPAEGTGSTGTTIDRAIADDERGPALAIATPFASDARCAAGGQALESGFDDDGDGLLGAGEITSTTVQCNAPDGGAALPPVAGDADPLCDTSRASLRPPVLTLSVQGPGYFVLASPDPDADARLYTRALDLYADDTGRLRDAHQLLVLGTATGESAALVPLDAAPPVRSARTTSAVHLGLNLDADAALAPAWTGGSPRNESSYASELVVFDSGGAARRVELYFARTAARSWAWHAVVDASELADPGGYESGSGELAFDAQGRLVGDGAAELQLSFLGAAPDQRVRLDFAGSTSLARTSSLGESRQDGYGAGSIAGYQVAATGELSVAYSTGGPLPLGRLALAALRPDAAVTHACKDLWLSLDAAPPGVVLGVPGANALGAIAVFSARGAP